jgi:hypothetical protein
MNIKKMMVLAAMALAAVALAIPAGASAWYDAGVEVTSNKVITATGSAKFEGEIGSVNCTKGVDAEGTLFASSDNGQITKFEVTSPETNCDVEGGLKTLGCTSLSSAIATTPGTTPWPVDGITASDDATVTNVVIDNTLTGGVFCPKTFTLEGSTTMSFDNPKAIKTITLGGTLLLTSSVGNQNVNVTGTLAVTPSGTYGLTK